MFVKFIAGLGPKFNFINRPHDPVPFNDVFLSFEEVMNETNGFGEYQSVKHDLDLLKTNFANDRRTNATQAQIFIRQLYERTRSFLHVNKDIVIAPADKGGKTVIMTRKVYNDKVKEHLDANLANHTYFHWKDATTEKCRQILEPKCIRMKINPFFRLDYEKGFKNCCYPLKSEPYIIAKIYCLIKVHKEGFPSRPIISSPDSWAKDLSLWILRKLELIAVLFDEFNVHNSEDFVHLLNGSTLNGNNQRLSNWDYESMFTNIPFPFAKRIIIENYSIVERETTVPVDLFIEAVSFLIEYSCYFIYDSHVYRQTKGLTMGNRLSQILADMCTNLCNQRQSST